MMTLVEFGKRTQPDWNAEAEKLAADHERFLAEFPPPFDIEPRAFRWLSGMRDRIADAWCVLRGDKIAVSPYEPW